VFATAETRFDGTLVVSCRLHITQS